MTKSTISTFELFAMFPDQEAARSYLEGRLWPNGPRCPVCGLGERITTRKGGFYRCNQCKEDFTDISRQHKLHGRPYTPDQWKVIFMHACGREVQFLPALDGSGFIPWGQSSSDLSKEEMTALIEFMFAWGAENGTVWSDPAERNVA